MMKKRKIAALAVLLLLLYLAGNTISICAYSLRDERCEADVIIVLGAAAYEEEVSPVYRERLNHSIDLYQRGYGKKIIVTGGVAKGNTHSDAYVAAQYLLSQQVPEADILMEESSTITQENLENSRALMEENGFQSAIIVSDPLHMKRAMLLAEDEGIEAYSSPTPTTMYRSWRTKAPFLAREVFYYVGYRWWRVVFR